MQVKTGHQSGGGCNHLGHVLISEPQWPSNTQPMPVRPGSAAKAEPTARSATVAFFCFSRLWKTTVMRATPRTAGSELAPTVSKATVTAGTSAGGSNGIATPTMARRLLRPEKTLATTRTEPSSGNRTDIIKGLHTVFIKNPAAVPTWYHNTATPGTNMFKSRAHSPSPKAAAKPSMTPKTTCAPSNATCTDMAVAAPAWIIKTTSEAKFGEMFQMAAW
mmetsp:Transcript_101133/g.291147  ORF Transcript_101133/g.291147 Transcript_101133/m.291147 type:complete len:219 (+) Transcript_101133:563-1219(+)